MNSDSRRSQKYLPSLATPSLKSVLDTCRAEPTSNGEVPGGYGYLITKLSASGSKADQSDPDEELDDLGAEAWRSSTGAKMRLSYEVDWDDTGEPTNPLDSKAISRISDLIDRVGMVDASVSMCRVMFWDETLADAANVDDELWHMTLQSSHVDGEHDRTEIEKHPENMTLIEQEGFKYMVLNCRRLIDRRQELNQSRAKQQPTIVWNGDTFGGLRNELGIEARRIANRHMGDYGIGKRYEPGAEDSITLVSVESPDESTEARA